MLTGDNGLINQTINANKQTDIAGTREQIEIELMARYDTDGHYTNGDVIEAVQTVTGQTVKEGDTTVITAKGNEVDISDLWKETTLLEMYLAGESCTTENCTDENHLHIGDYVSYQPSNTDSATNYVEVEESETGYSSTQRYEYNEITQWRVLGLTEDRKQVKLISANPISKAGTDEDDLYLALKGAKGYLNCESTLDDICSIYSNSSLGATAKSIRMEDINLALGVTVTKNENGVPTVTYNGSNIDQYSQNGYLESYTYTGSDYTPEGYVKSEKATAGEIVYRTAYWYGMSNFTDSTVKSLIFDGTDSQFNNNGIGYGKYYWVAFPGVCAYSSCAYFGPGLVFYGYAYCSGNDLFYSYGYSGTYWWAVRPVVYLGSNVTKTQVGKTTAISDATWDGKVSPSDEEEN